MSLSASPEPLHFIHEVRAEVRAVTAQAMAEFLTHVPDQATVSIHRSNGIELVATWPHEDADDAMHDRTCLQHPHFVFDIGQDIAARPADYGLQGPGAADYDWGAYPGHPPAVGEPGGPDWGTEQDADPVQLEGTGQAFIAPCPAQWNDRPCIRPAGHQAGLPANATPHVYQAAAKGGDLYAPRPTHDPDGVRGLAWAARQQAASDAQYGKAGGQ